MSMPSSSDEVATSAGSRPALSESSISRRCSRAIDPWWERTRSGASSSPSCSRLSSLRRSARRSARRREFTKMSVEVCARISDNRTGWIDGQIDVRVCGSPAAGPLMTKSGDVASTRWPSWPMSSTGTMTSRSSSLRTPVSTIVTSLVATAEVAGDLVERSLRRRQPDPLRCLVAGVAAQPVEPLEGEREVGAALGGSHHVDLVEDDVLDRGEHLPRLGGEHEVERLRCRHQDVGRMARDVAPLLLGGVAGAGAHADAGGGEAHAREGGPQVPLHVVGQRLERGHVQHLAALTLVGWRWLRGEAVEGPEEGGQRLPGPGRGEDQRVVAGRDGLPTLLLRRRGRRERRGEPLPRRLGEPVQHRHANERRRGV